MTTFAARELARPLAFTPRDALRPLALDPSAQHALITGETVKVAEFGQHTPGGMFGGTP